MTNRAREMTLATGKDKETRSAFTLMEMLVVMAVIVILLGISIPFFSGFTKGTKLKTAAQDITASLNAARGMAITYRKSYSVVFDYSEKQGTGN